jgi:WD40 repeat protein
LLLTGDGARAVLIGTGNHAPGSPLPAVPQVAGTLTALGQCLTERCGLAAAHLTVVRDPDSPSAIRASVRAAADEASDTLLVYYTGHGLLSLGQGALHLATSAYTDERPDALEDQALPFRRLVDTVNDDCRAATVILILDCCYSGCASVSALDWAVFMSVGWDDRALVPRGHLYPAYTGELIRVLTEGDPHGPPELTLLRLHEYLTDALARARMPEPRAFFGARLPRLVLTRNRAYAPRADQAPEPVSGEEPAYEDVCPYLGLEPYTVRDERFFSGRRKLTGIVIERMARRLWTGGPLFVIGASGSGKSSLLAGGVLPGIARGGFGIPTSAGWPRVIVTPGSYPVDAFARALADASGIPAAGLRAALNGNPDAIRDAVTACVATAGPSYGAAPGQEPRLVVVVDQAEELLTLCWDEAERHQFLAILAVITERTDSRMPLAAVALGLRSEFFTEIAGYPEVGNAPEPEPVVVGAMTADELRSAITEPAETIGLQLEADLANRLIEEIGADPGQPNSAGYDPGALPLLSYALLATWQQKSGPRLTIAGYRAAGAVKDALRKAADGALAELDGSPQAQQAMRELLLQLISVGQDRPDTRRRVPRDELIARSPDRARALDVLVARRLVTTDEDQVQLTHEALIQAWPALRAWINQDRDRRLAEQELADQAMRWEQADQARSYLYQGEQLARMLARLGGAGTGRVHGRPGRFLAASNRQERRRKMARNGYTGLLAVIAVIAVVLAIIANQDSSTATQQRDLAQAREYVAEAGSVAGTQPSIARQLLAQAYRMAPDTPLTEGGLLTSLAIPGVVATPAGVNTVAYGGGGSWLAIATTSSSVLLADPATGSVLARIAYPDRTDAILGAVPAAAVSPDGHLLGVSANEQDDLWLVNNPRHPVRLSTISLGGESTALAFGDGGKILATTAIISNAGIRVSIARVSLWNIADPARPVPLGTSTMSGTFAEGMAFSPDGRVLAVNIISKAERTMLYAVSPDGGLTVVGSLPVTRGTPGSMAFAPTGSLLALSTNGSPTLWNTADPAKPALVASLADPSDVESVAFSPDGRTLAAAGENSIVLWNVSQPGTPTRFADPSTSTGATTLAFSPDGNALATADDGPDAAEAVDLWSTPQPGAMSSIATPVGVYTYAAVSPGSRVLALGYGNGAGLWDLAQPQDPRVLRTVANPDPALSALTNAVAFDPHGQVLALAGGTDVSLWNVAYPDRPVLLTTITLGNSSVNTAINAAFSPDGQLLAIEETEQVKVWNVADPARPALVRSVPLGVQAILEETSPLGFSPDSKTLAFATVGTQERGLRSGPPALWLWQLTGSAPPARLALPGCACDIDGLAFSPDGTELAVATSAGAYLDPVTGQQAGHPRQLSSLASTSASPVAFSPGGHFLAIGAAANTLIWDTSTLSDPAQIAVLPAPDGGISPDSIAFSGNGQLLVTGYTDGTAAIWDTDLADLASRLCRDAGPVISQSAWNQFLPGVAYNPPCR